MSRLSLRVYGALSLDVKPLDIKHLNLNNVAMGEPDTDHLDAQLDVWTREIPTLDRLTEGIVERIGKLARYFDHSMAATLAETGLSPRAYRVLGRLRYQGPPYQLSAGQLAEAMGLSSGAMTNRLDRLEQAGLVRRIADPDDRRGVLVEPTDAGHAAWDRTVHTQATREALIASVLSDGEKDHLHSLLRRLMAAFPDEIREAAKRSKAKTHADDED
jgi:DNA-binding MarR family transcriptional regulator